VQSERADLVVQAAGICATPRGEIQRDDTVVARNKSRQDPCEVARVQSSPISRTQRLQMHILRVRSEQAGHDLMCCCRGRNSNTPSVAQGLTTTQRAYGCMCASTLSRWSGSRDSILRPEEGMIRCIRAESTTPVYLVKPSFLHTDAVEFGTLARRPISSDMSHPLRMIRTPHKARHKCLVDLN
jgi:hypothetical protein